MQQIEYTRTVVPSSMRSSYWKYFGFPSDNSNNILTRQKIVCTICNTAIAYNKNTSNLRTHLTAKHPETFQQLLANKQSTNEQEVTESACKNIVKFKVKEAIIDNVATASGVQHEQLEDRIDEISEVQELDESVSLNHSLNQAAFIQQDITTQCQEQHQQQSLENMLADMIQNDLLSISSITGEGFRTYNQQVSGLIVDDEIYQRVKNELRERIAGAQQHIATNVYKLSQISPYSLSLEFYKNSDDLTILNIYFNFLDDKQSRHNSILYHTTIADNEIDIFEILKEVNIKNCKCIVVNSLASLNEGVVKFARCYGMDIIECLATTLERCLQKIFQLPILAQLFVELYQNVRNNQALKPPPRLRILCCWSKLNFLAFLYEHVDDSKWEKLSEIKAIYQYIKPMKLALDIISDEQLPLCSLSQPLIIKLFEQHFSEPQSNVTLSLIKGILENDLKLSIKQSSFLLEATYFDARFRNQFVLPEAPFDFNDLKTKVIERFTNILDLHYIARPTKALKLAKELTNTKKSNLKAFFDNSETDPASKCTTLVAKTNLDVEFEKYHMGIALDLEQSPILWWQGQPQTYNELGKIVFYYFTTPCCCVHRLFNIDVEQRWQKLSRRKELNYFCDIERNLWLLHYNEHK